MSARIQLTVTFMDDQTRYFAIGDDDAAEAQSWHVSCDQGVPTLIVGHGVPRLHIPLIGVRYFQVGLR